MATVPEPALIDTNVLRRNSGRDAISPSTCALRTPVRALRRNIRCLTRSPFVHRSRVMPGPRDRLLLRQPIGNQPRSRLAPKSLQQYYARARQVELLTGQLELEKRLASLVEDAYGLTAEERALLRSTRPIRDSIDVLEGRIRGSAEMPADLDQP